MTNVRFTARVRAYQESRAGVKPTNERENTRFRALGAELKAKCPETSDHAKVDSSLKVIEKCTKTVLGEDSNYLDRDELGVKLYNETAVWVKYEAVTKAYEEIDNTQKLQSELELKVCKLKMVDVKDVMNAVKVVCKLTADYKPWTADWLKKITSPYDEPDELVDELQECMKQLKSRAKMLKQESETSSGFHMAYDEHAQKAFEESQKTKENDKVNFDAKWLQNQLSSAGDRDDVSHLLNSVIRELQGNHSNETLQEALFSLLGFKFVELIPDIIQNRNQIVNDAIRLSRAFAATGRFNFSRIMIFFTFSC